MARRIRRNRQKNLLKAQKKAQRQRLKAVMALGGLLALSPGFIFPPALMAIEYVGDEQALNAALGQDPVEIIFTGNISVSGNISPANSAAARVDIKGGGYTLTGNSGSLFNFSNPAGNPLYLSSLTLTQGLAISGGGMYVGAMNVGSVSGNSFTNNSAGSAGGGIYVGTMSGGSFTGNTFSNNSAYDDGGGMYMENMNGGSFIGNSLSGNSAQNGGGIYVGTMSGGSFTSNTFNANNAENSSGDGGGIYVNTMSGGSFTGNSLSGNSAYQGGGIYVGSMSGGSLSGNTFNANITTIGNGGGMFVSAMNGGSVNGNSLTNNSGVRGGGMFVNAMNGGAISGNTFNANSGNFGGGMFVSAMNGGAISGNTFNANSALYGGGMFVDNMVDGSVTGNSLTNNSASGDGGGMFVYNMGGRLVDNHFVGNQAEGYGGAIYYGGFAASGTLNISASDGASAVFSGNLHKAGSAAYSPNSIYFNTPSGMDNQVEVTLHAGAGGVIDMRDAMQSAEATGTESLTLNLNKTGQGLWQLAGHNHMQGPATWTISEGELALLNDSAGAPAHIELSDSTSPVPTGRFSLGANAVLSLQAPATGSHQISARDVTLEQDALIRVDTSNLSSSAAALKINTPSLNLPGPFTMDAINAGALDGDYTLLEDNLNTDYRGKVTGLFDGQSGYTPINERYASQAYFLDSPGKVVIKVKGADQARAATWTNGAGDSLWNQTSENWVLEGSTAKVYKAGDSPIFSGRPDGEVKVDGAMQANVMTVQSGDYIFSPRNPGGGQINANELYIQGGSAAFDLPASFNGGRGLSKVGAGGSMIIAPGARLSFGRLEIEGALKVVPVSGAHQLQADSIVFSQGSQVGVTGFSYGPKLDKGQHTVLSLSAGSVVNNSFIPETSGSIKVGAFDYSYNNLYWDGDNLLLVVDGAPSKINAERAAVAATTGPLAIAAQNQVGDWLMARFNSGRWNYKNPTPGRQLSMLNPGRLSGRPGVMAARGLLLDKRAGLESGRAFSDTPPLAPAAFTTGGGPKNRLAGWLADANGGGELLLGNASLWFTPSYSYTDNSGRSDYKIKNPAWAGGYEQWFNDSLFLGLGLSGSLPEYESNHADIDGRNLTFALYGGTILPWEIELGAFLAYGRTSYDQTRRVEGERYSADYDSKNLGLGFNLGRDFALDESGLYVLRPFVTYEYMRVDVDGYNEGGGTYALDVDGYRANLHFARVGLDGTVTAPDSGAHATGRIYYAGQYGDREAETRAFFTNDPANPFGSVGDALDKHSLGLGVSVGLPLGEAWELQAGYNYLAGKNNATHHGNIGFLFKF